MTVDIVNSLNLMLEKVHGIIAMVATSADSMAGASTNVREVSSATSHDVLNQKTETDRVSNAMQQMANTVSDVGAHADDANRAAKEANDKAVSVMSRGREQAELSVSDSNQISVALKTIADSIASVSESTTKGAQKTEQASIELQQLANDLRTAVGQFKISST